MLIYALRNLYLRNKDSQQMKKYYLRSYMMYQQPIRIAITYADSSFTKKVLSLVHFRQCNWIVILKYLNIAVRLVCLLLQNSWM